MLGEKSDLVKSIFPLSSGIKKIRVHQPLLKNGNFTNADGSKWKSVDGSPEHSLNRIYNPAFIYHRLFRSSLEYVSTLMKGNIRGAEIPLKTNRHGLP